MGAEPGAEKLYTNTKYLPLFRTFSDRLLQRTRRQTVFEGGCSAYAVHPWAGFIKGADFEHIEQMLPPPV